MRRLRSSALLLLLAAVCLSQTPLQLMTPAIRRVGDRLACKCGTCNNTVGNCPMIECHYSSPARQKIGQLLQSGMSDDAIVASFVKENGLDALAVPPAEGFSLLSWVMPFVAIAIGLGVIWLYIKRFRKPMEATLPALEPAVDRRYQDRIEKELSED
jgi:cytochrome c-type biogenesis protein CcmH